MLTELLKDAYFKRLLALYKKGTDVNKIIKFDDEFYKKLENTIVSTIPVSIHIKCLKPNEGIGKCFDRSLYMFYALDNVTLVRADTKDLEYRYGKELSRHGWVEDDFYVYDPSLLSKIDKKLYYKMFMPTNVVKCTKEEYLKNDINKKAYYDVSNTKIEDYMPNGKNRIDLLNTIPVLLKLADSDDILKEELNKYLDRIEYNYTSIYKSVAKEYKKMLLSKKII